MAETDQRLSISDRFLSIARSPKLLPFLLLFAVFETTFIPLPYEAVFVALCLAARPLIGGLIFVSVLGSAIGGSIVYWIGATYFDDVVLRFGIVDLAATYSERFSERGASFIFLGGTTPAPSFVINLIAGAVGYPYWEFVGIFATSRLVRFGLLGLLLYVFGEQLISAWSRLPVWARRGLTVLLILGLVYWFASGLTG